jgi:thioredoxin reductase (NADPH)
MHSLQMSTTDQTPPETPDRVGAFPRLSEAQIEKLATVGARHGTREGEILFREGDAQRDFFVIRSGLVAILEDYEGPRERVVGIHGAGRFLGELGLITGQATFLTAVVRQPGEVLVVPADRVRRLVTHDPVLGDLILRALVLRRSMLIELGVGFRIIGSRYSPDTRRLRDFAARNRLPHHWIDLEHDPDAEALLQSVGVAPHESPIVVVRRDRVLRNPSNAELARVLGLRATSLPETVNDLIVCGAGPAGLAASVYGASEGLLTVALESMATGGQAGTTSRIENYLGFPAGISGAELAERATIQARKFGAQITVPGEAVSLEADRGLYRVITADGDAICGRAVVIASGVRYRKLSVPGLSELEGVSVYYAATQTEAQLCAGDPVVAVGGGNSAGQATLFLARHVPRVHLVIREHDLDENMSRYLAARIERTPSVEVLPHCEVRELIGDRALEALVVEDTDTGERRTVEARALFVFIGAEPHTEWLRGVVELDDGGYVLTGEDAAPFVQDRIDWPQRRAPALLETSLPGVFAAGDVRSGSIQRVSAAVGDGATAIRLVHQHLGGREPSVQLAQTYVSSK